MARAQHGAYGMDDQVPMPRVYAARNQGTLVDSFGRPGPTAYRPESRHPQEERITNGRTLQRYRCRGSLKRFTPNQVFFIELVPLIWSIASLRRCDFLSFIKNQYDSLHLSAQKKESGELSILLQIGLPVNILKQMDIYAYHLEHPNLSQFQVALHMRVQKFTVWLAYRAMNEPLT